MVVLLVIASRIESVPTNLKHLLSMLLNGSSIKDQNSPESQSCLTISWAIMFNCTARPSKTSSHHHSRKFEPPSRLYIWFKVRTLSWPKSYFQSLVSWVFFLLRSGLTAWKATIPSCFCERSNETGNVCPSQLHHDLFIVGTLDNNDKNPSSTTAKDSFHRTWISLFQLLSEVNKRSWVL